jgi:uroporphyrinogen decarboxylase
MADQHALQRETSWIRPTWMPPPDYRRLLTTLRHEEPDRVPIAELGVDPPIKEKLLGRPVRAVEDDVEFWYRAGYDYIYLRPAYEFPGTMLGNVTTGQPKYDQIVESDEKTIPMTESGIITTMADLDRYAWPDPACDAYYQPLTEAAQCLPSGMGLISGVGGIFTRVWMLLGFERFCIALSEDPELIAELFRRVAAIQIAVLKRVIRQPGLIAVWYGDDLAYTKSFMVSPKVYRKLLFPHMEEMAAIAHGAGMPFMYHTDGRLWDVIPDLIALGVDALHPIETMAMDITEVKRRYGKQLSLIGNIDPNTLGLGTPEQVRAEVRRRIQELAPGGGYAVGASPGIAYYTRMENYEAMRRCAFEYGVYPITP